jgi:cell division protein FtsL
MAETKSNNGLKVIAGLLLLLLIGLVFYTVSLYKDKEDNATKLTSEKDAVVQDLTSLRSEYDKAILESNATNEELVSARDNIAKYIDSVKTMKLDISSLGKYRRQVTVLTRDRDRLIRKVDSLTRSNAMIAMERDSTYVELEKQTVFNDSLVVQNTQLADVVERGSALNISKLAVDAVKERNSGKLVSTSRAGTTDKFKVCFTLTNNSIAQAGDKEFYIEVLDPQGNVLGESYSRTAESGASVTYSKATAFYYENKALDVCDYINKPASDFQKGNYMVNVYDNKLKLLGTSKFTLK